MHAGLSARTGQVSWRGEGRSGLAGASHKVNMMPISAYGPLPRSVVMPIPGGPVLAGGGARALVHRSERPSRTVASLHDAVLSDVRRGQCEMPAADVIMGLRIARRPLQTPGRCRRQRIVHQRWRSPRLGFDVRSFWRTSNRGWLRAMLARANGRGDGVRIDRTRGCGDSDFTDLTDLVDSESFHAAQVRHPFRDVSAQAFGRARRWWHGRNRGGADMFAHSAWTTER